MNPIRRRTIPLLLAGVFLGVCVFVSSCSPTTRYQVLSAVFDGVPPPPGVALPDAEATGTGGTITPFRTELDRLRAQREPRPPAPSIKSVHAPVSQRLCNECHDLENRGGDIRHDATLCDRCHLEERREGGWDHGPINLGTCIPCHLPHRSQHEHLLSDSLPGLCLNCHEVADLAAKEYHDVANYDACTACHDPHRMY